MNRSLAMFLGFMTTASLAGCNPSSQIPEQSATKEQGSKEQATGARAFEESKEGSHADWNEGTGRPGTAPSKEFRSKKKSSKS
jgi:hypothetical protein